MSKKVTYQRSDAGCYVDSVRGIYAVDSIVEFAESHGFLVVLNKCDCQSPPISHSRASECAFSDGIEDEATSFMNDNFPVDGHFWGRNDNGDWGLWESESEEDYSSLATYCHECYQDVSEVCEDCQKCLDGCCECDEEEEE